MGVSLLFLHRNLINFRRDTLYIVFVGYIPYHLMTGLSANLSSFCFSPVRLKGSLWTSQLGLCSMMMMWLIGET